MINLAILTFVFSLGASTAYALPDEYDQSSSNDEVIENRINILATFETHDYESWKKSVDLGSADLAIFSKSAFDKFMKARELARQGKYSQALKLMDELEVFLKQSGNVGLDVISKRIKSERIAYGVSGGIENVRNELKNRIIRSIG